VAIEVVEIFREIYKAKFPIAKMKLIDDYGANDDLSMADNNTSAFCVRSAQGYDDKYSKHSYGVAIDINPVQNPYVKGEIILPKSGESYLDRQKVRKGMIVEDHVVYRAFIKRGWIWGGKWQGLQDYQHFEKDF